MAITDRLNRFIYGSLNEHSQAIATRAGPEMEQRASAGGLVMGGSRSQAVWPNYGIDGTQKRAYSISTLAACVDAIARDVSAAPLRVFREVDGQPVAEDNHPARLVVRSPNPTQSEPEFMYFVTAMALVTGFCVIEKVRSGAGRPVELWPLISPWLQVKPKAQGSASWIYRVPGNDPWLLDPEDVIVVTYRPNMWGGETGRTPLDALKRELAIDDQMTDFLNLVLEQGGVGPIGLRVPAGPDGLIRQLPEAERDRIVETFAQKYGGAGNWTRPVFLGGVSVERIGFSLQEMLFPDVREMIELHVCSVLGVPAGMIGTAAGLARNTYSNAENDVTKYFSSTITPFWTRLGGAFTRGLVREFDPNGPLSMAFDTTEISALMEDDEPRWVHAQAALGAGMILLDEARAEIGLDALPGGAGQVLFLPFSSTVMKPADLLAEAEPKPVPAALAPFAADDEDGPLTDEDTEPIDDPDAKSGRQQRSLRRLSARRRESLHTRSKQSMMSITKRGVPLLRQFWREQGERIIAALEDADARYAAMPESKRELLGGANGSRATRAVEDIDWAFEERELGQVLARYYSLAGSTAYTEASNLLGVQLDWNLANPHVRLLMDRLATRVVGISEHTRRDVSRIVAEGLTEGVSMPQLSDRLRGQFEQIYRNRAETVARTEAQIASNTASQTAYLNAGVRHVELLDGTSCTSGPGDDGLTCPERNQMIVPVEGADAHVWGTHPNCVLALSPIVSSLGDD